MRYNNKPKGQSTLEFTIMMAMVIGAFLLMQIYMKRGMQGKLRESADQIGEQFEAKDTVIKDAKVNRTAKTVQIVKDGVTTVNTGAAGADGGTKETRTESGKETVAAF